MGIVRAVARVTIAISAFGLDPAGAPSTTRVRTRSLWTMAPLKPILDAAAAACATDLQSSTDGVLHARKKGDDHADEVKAFLKTHFTTPVVLSDYTEKLHGSVIQKRLIASGALLERLRKLQPNLSFSALFVKDFIATDRKSTWNFGNDDRSDFAESQSKKLRAMMRHNA